MIRNTKNPHGGDIYSNRVQYDFSVNVSPLGTPPEILSAIGRAAVHVAEYPDAHCERLLNCLADYEQISKEWMICGNGASDLIYTYAGVAGGEKALIVAPTFCEYANGLAAAGVETEYFQLSESNGFVLDKALLEVLTARLEEKPAIASVWICNPNNPTGKVYSYEVMSMLAEACRRLQIRLFVDECFMDFTEIPERNSLKSVIASNPYVFLLKAFTKNYGMAGVRLGYGISSDEELLERMCASTPAWNVSGLAQAAGIAACACSEFLQQTQATIRTERSYLLKEFKCLGLQVVETDANFILFQADSSVYAKLLEQGILIRDCSNFKGLEQSATGCYYRCAVRTHEENVRLIAALHAIYKVQEVTAAWQNHL